MTREGDTVEAIRDLLRRHVKPGPLPTGQAILRYCGFTSPKDVRAALLRHSVKIATIRKNNATNTTQTHDLPDHS